MTNSNTRTEDDIKWAEGIAHFEEVTRITILPEYNEWMGTPEWREHLFNHDGPPVLGCASCAVRPMLKVIHEAVMQNGQFLEETWALQDGYGAPGITPPQGWDWSGIRDSSPAAIDRMHSVVRGVELVEVTL